MKSAESLLFGMATENIDVAMDRIEQLLDEKRFPLSHRDYEWVRLVCAYSRCIHLNVWNKHTPKQRVKCEIVPLLKRAAEQVGSLIEHQHFADKQEDESKKILENIRLRQGNLIQRYLNDLDPWFPVDAIEPRLAARD